MGSAIRSFNEARGVGLACQIPPAALALDGSVARLHGPAGGLVVLA